MIQAAERFLGSSVSFHLSLAMEETEGISHRKITATMHNESEIYLALCKSVNETIPHSVYNSKASIHYFFFLLSADNTGSHVIKPRELANWEREGDTSPCLGTPARTNNYEQAAAATNSEV